MSRLITLDETDSTNSYIRAHLSELSDGDAVTALLQTAGRGRRGHSWSPDREMLPLSVLLRRPPYPAAVTLCAGVAVCRALKALCADFPETGIKWPNDIIVGGFKVCGILCESLCFGDRFDIICGIGVNLSRTRAHFDAIGLPHAASVKELSGITPDRNALALDIVSRLRELCKKDFSEIRGEYSELCLTLGREVRIVSENGERRAFAQGIAENGFLICRDESGEFEVNSGEVSVRGLLGYV